MNQYINVIRQSFALFPLLAFVFTTPYLFFNYHRYGSVWSVRILVIYSFILYLMTVYFLVILPLPSRQDVAHMTTPVMNLDPFGTIRDILKDLPEHGLAGSPALWQFLFNVLMLVPFGLYLHYWFGFSLEKTVAASFLLSLFFELTQLSGLYGIYPRAYRLFDVDDLIANTAGGLLGWGLYVPLSRLLPNRRAVDDKSRQQGQHVSFLRRFVGWMTDAILLLLVAGVSGRWFPEAATAYFLGWMVIGATPGMMAVSLKVESGRGLEGRLLRGLYLASFVIWLPVLCLWLPGLLALAGIVLWLALAVYLAAMAVSGKPTVFDQWTDSRIVSSIRR